MKKLTLALLIGIAPASTIVYADNIIRTNAPILKGSEWNPGPDHIGPWEVQDRQCSTWTPDGSTKSTSEVFKQNQTCDLIETRLIQSMLINDKGITKPSGDPREETRHSTNAEANTRDYSVSLSDWSDTQVTCQSWSPDPSTYGEGEVFTQTGSNCEVAQARERSEAYSLDGSTWTSTLNTIENQTLVNQTRTREAIGTDNTRNSAIRILNPVEGVSGIYTIDAGPKGTFQAYVDMTTEGGNWILVERWTSAVGSYFYMADAVVKGTPIKSYTNNATSYPVIKSGVYNTSSSVLLKSGNTTWAKTMGNWQVFQTFDKSHSFDSNGFDVKLSTGATRKMFHIRAGWREVQSVNTAHLGFMETWGPSGMCGGSGTGKGKYCPAMWPTEYAYHFDTNASIVKEIYIKSNN
jgi:hypothetical protein